MPVLLGKAEICGWAACESWLMTESVCHSAQVIFRLTEKYPCDTPNLQYRLAFRDILFQVPLSTSTMSPILQGQCDSMRTRDVPVPQSHNHWLSSRVPTALVSSSHTLETGVTMAAVPWPSAGRLPVWIYQLAPNVWSFQSVKKMHESAETIELHPREANSHVSSIPTKDA